MGVNPATASAIEACYDAALEFKRWPEALQGLADSLGVTSCVIRTRDPTHPFRSDQRRRTVTPDSTEHAEFAALWLERIEGAPDPHQDRLDRLCKTRPCFVVEDEVTTPEERRLLPYYQEIARPGDREWWASVSVVVRNRRWGLSMFRNARTGRFDPREADYFLRVAPDFGRIISMAEKVWDAAIGSTLVALERLNCAAVVLDCRGYLTRCNEHAEALFGDGLTILHRRIHAGDRASDLRLQELIAASVLSRPGGPVLAEPAVITRNGSPWLLAEAVPMTSFAHDLFNGGDALLCFTDLVAERMPSERLVIRAFRLTAAEARLALALASGEGVDAASAKLAIGRETARTHPRAIFVKTGTHR